MDKQLADNTLPKGLAEKLGHAWALSREAFGQEIIFYLPGMFRYNGIAGRYPAVSITGERCELMCEHCKGSLLRTMPDASGPEKLLSMCLELKEAGHHGVLLSGGCDSKGRLPWAQFAEAIARAKEATGLYITVHCGIVGKRDAQLLKDSGVDQALLDVIGDDETYRRIYHSDLNVSDIVGSMQALREAGMDIVPHVVCGLYFGAMRAERKALQMIAPFDVSQVVVVAVMPQENKGKFVSPSAQEVAELIAEARLMMPKVRLALGCARKRGNVATEILAVKAGINRMAIPSDEAVEAARALGLTTRYQRTCCSVSMDITSDNW